MDTNFHRRQYSVITLHWRPSEDVSRECAYVETVLSYVMRESVYQAFGNLLIMRNNS